MTFSGSEFDFRLVPKYFLVAIIGALIAGVYGILHDQVTYSISVEYFTRLKFFQFQWADPHCESPRVFVAIIGFLATWSVGLVAGWFLARFAVVGKGKMLPLGEIVKYFPVLIVTTFLFGVAGWGWGYRRRSTGYADGWLNRMDDLQVENHEAFMTVAYIHNFGYAGALVGLILALILLHRNKTTKLRL